MGANSVVVAAASHTSSRTRAPQQRSQQQRSPRIRWDRVSRAAMLFALIVLLYLAISPVRALFADLHLSAERRAELQALQRTAQTLAAEQQTLQNANTNDAEARHLGFVRPGERAYYIKNLPPN